MTTPRIAPPPLRILATFALAGPPIGYLLFCAISSRSAFGGPVFGVALALALHGIPFLLAYLLGLVPAVATGLAAAVATRLRRAWVYLLVSGLAGAATTTTWAVTMSQVGLNRSHESLGQVARITTPLGLLAGLACGAITLRWTGDSLSLWRERPQFLKTLHAGEVMLGVLICGMAIMIATLLVPALQARS